MDDECLNTMTDLFLSLVNFKDVNLKNVLLAPKRSPLTSQALTGILYLSLK